MAFNAATLRGYGYRPAESFVELLIASSAVRTSLGLRLSWVAIVPSPKRCIMNFATKLNDYVVGARYIHGDPAMISSRAEQNESALGRISYIPIAVRPLKG